MKLMRTARLGVTFIALLVMAFGLTAIGWWWTISPGVPKASHTIAYVLDWPVAFVGTRLFPNHFAGIDLFFGTNMCDFCSARELLTEHAKFAVPIYWLLLVSAWVSGAVVGRARRRRKAGERTTAAA